MWFTRTFGIINTERSVIAHGLNLDLWTWPGRINSRKLLSRVILGLGGPQYSNTVSAILNTWLQPATQYPTAQYTEEEERLTISVLLF